VNADSATTVLYVLVLNDMEKYLDIDKSVIISSPAGSGKTEKLARRYIALLQSGVDVERILAITFTDKAAAEMKDRILRILREEDRDTFQRVIEKVSLMRVSTIHSFCGSLLRRFSFEIGVDPDYRVIDAIDSDIAWEEMIYDVLMDMDEEDEDLFLRLLGERGFRGLQYLKETMRYLYSKSPFSLETYIPSIIRMDDHLEELLNWPGARESVRDYERILKEGRVDELGALRDLFLSNNGMPRRKRPARLKDMVDYPEWTVRMYEFWLQKNMEAAINRSNLLIRVFRRCIDRYTQTKRARGILDFDDLEYLAYKVLTEEPEWANILYAFDEKTDHILVDEFQDTNDFQWAIIDKLTEEWRSGMGAKRDSGIRPTIFLVGDEKQSIFFFRGANVEVFNRAKERLSEWLGREFQYKEAKENYRSLPAIIDFTNYVFSRVMNQEEEAPPWKTRYSLFTTCRKDVTDTGKVELIIHDRDYEDIIEARQNEAEIISKKIQSIVGQVMISDRKMSAQRPCEYRDIAILLRRRTHLRRYEDSLRKHGIPFVTVKGIGFYQEPEIAILRALIYFLSNPSDDYSLYILLKSPFFMVDEGSILRLASVEGNSLYERLMNMKKPPECLDNALKVLLRWQSLLTAMPLSEMIEHTLISTGAWRYFHEQQRRANIKKFIRIVEGLQADGKSIFRIRDFLERTYHRDDEPKANVDTEGMDAVRIITIHSAKGLEFPVVFLPGLEEAFRHKSEENLVYEKEGRFYFKSIPESSIRRVDEDFVTHRMKELEEEKRLLYVAVTRAEDMLFLVSRWDERGGSFFAMIRDALGLRREADGFTMDADIKGFSILREVDVENAYKKRSVKRRRKKAGIIPAVVSLPEIERVEWKTVTETVDIRSKHGRGWLVLGEILHRLFEETSKGFIKEEGVGARLQELLIESGIDRGDEIILKMIEENISLLKERGIWQEIILPRKDSFAELPFIMELNGDVYTGRVDRVIKRDGEYRVYDYKTFPVKEKEVEYLLREYSPQLSIYREAVRRIFNTTDVRSYIIFTYTGEVREVG
jgi:ATP-dependent helicase/nuclease subunit A